MSSLLNQGFLVLALLAATVTLSAESLEEWGTQQGKRIALPKLIQLISGHELYDWDETQANVFNLAAKRVLSEVAKKPIVADRINEVGNAVELLVLEALAQTGIDVGRPQPPSGRKKTAGYPDLFASTDDDYYYIEIKTYSPKTIRSSQRTFYISPSEDFKVTRDAFHLLLAFSTEEIEDGVYSLTGFKLLDLHGLECQLKLEFNASNKDLYDPASGLIVVEE